MSGWAAAISAGSNLLSSWMASEDAEDNRTLQRETTASNLAMQREFAQNGIRWRTEDAKAAGLHPLYALTGQGASYTPSAVQTESSRAPEYLSRAGQDVSRAVMAAQDEHARNLRKAQLLTLEAQSERDFAQASYYRSLANREQPSTSFPTDVVTDAYNNGVVVGGRDFPKIEAHPLYKDAVKLQSDEMTSRSGANPGETSGRDHPGMRQFEFPGGFRALVPATGGGGIPEEIDVSMLPLVLGANLEKYGWRWVIDLMGYMTGRSPDARRESGTLESWLRRKLESGNQDYRRRNERHGLK